MLASVEWNPELVTVRIIDGVKGLEGD